MKPQIISESPISVTELKEELVRVKARDGELNFRASKTEEYLNLVVKLTDKETKELYKKIEELNIPRMKPEHIVKIIDLMPKTVDDIKLFLQGDPITVTQENMKKIIDLIEAHSAKAK
jgi:DNA-directed RNA polymerase subunit F